MADTTILSGDVGVTWFDNNRQKRLTWEGSTGTYTMNELYSAMQTLQDETTTIDDGTCFSAETPTEYTVGIIDQGDNDPWYITYELMEHVTGGALKTASWTRTEGTATGIIMVEVSSTAQAVVKADEGYDIVMNTDGDTGTLLEVISDGGASDYLVIRPDSNAAANSFDTTSYSLVCNAHTATTVTAVGKTGEQIWANIYSIGTVEDVVHMYVYQGAALTVDARTRVYSWNDNTVDWYGNGHIDITVALKDMTDITVGSVWTVIDGGYLNVFARKGGDLYASFEVANSTTSGGRNPVPLQTAVDLDQGHGTAKISTGSWGGDTFTDGEVIGQATTLARGIIDLTNSTADSEIVYFPIATAADGGALTAMADTYLITGETSTDTATATGAAAADGPADAAWFSGSGVPTLTIGNATFDIDNEGTDEYYAVTIDCNQNRLSEVYQWVKYVTQYGQGETDAVEQAFEDDLTQINIYGEEYIGGTASINYTGGTTPDNIAEGESVTQQTSLATGVVVSHNTADDVVLLRSTRGTFGAYTIDADDDSSTWTTVTASNFAAKTASPFGTFAGGTFFGARGVLLSDWHADDENAFLLTDIDGGTYERPASVLLTITNLVGGAESSDEHDRVSMFRLDGSGGNVLKTEYNVTGTPTQGDATLAVAETIADDHPAAGSLVIVVDPGLATAAEYKVRYTSYTGSTFTLANGGIKSADATTNATTLVDAAGGFTAGAKRGDLVWSSDHATLYAYVETVDSDTQLTLAGAGIVGLVDTDAYELNCVPKDLDTGDDVYVPFIDKIATADSEAVSVIYDGQIYYRVKVRNTRNTSVGDSIKIRPFSSDGTTTGSDVSVQVTRTEDTIIT